MTQVCKESFGSCGFRARFSNINRGDSFTFNEDPKEQLNPKDRSEPL
jgi:hypothetical protein